MNKCLFPFRVVAAFCLLFLASCSKMSIEPSGEPSLAISQKGKAPLYRPAESASAISDSYMVIFRDDLTAVEEEIDRISQTMGIRATYRYKYAVKGFAARLPAAALEAIQNNPMVKYVEQDQLLHLDATSTTAASWGLDRIDQKALPLNGTYSYETDGSTIDAYIFDTGIWLAHNEFGGRAVAGYDAFGGNSVDQNGHGTHVSGTVGGATYGIAKKIRLIAVRVLDAGGGGTSSGVVAGLDWAVSNHTTNPAVGNMSLGGGSSTTLDNACKNVINDGIVLCVAAGNSSVDAINTSPAHVTEAITVGATTSSDALASYSNYGSVVDILAPGSSIKSSWYGSNTAVNTISGTSMATPHVAGAAALYLEANPGSTPAQVSSGLKAIATSSKISGVPSSTVNLLLYSPVATVPDPVPANPVLASPADKVTNLPASTVLSWNPSTYATAYTVQVSTASNFSSISYSGTNLTGTSFSISGLSSNTIYYWRVNAANSSGTSGWSAAWQFTTQNFILVAPDAPALISPSSGATNVSLPARLSWAAAAGAATYTVQVSTTVDFSNPLYNKSGLTALSVNVGGLKRNTLYYWRVRAMDASGSLTGSWSTAWSFSSQR